MAAPPPFRKICLIVDNPLRDLDGMVLLAWHLAAEDCAVYLVPMYHLPEVMHIRPDFVLANYIRGVNEKLVATWASLGIAVGVLDTEGGVLTRENIDDMARDLLRNLAHIPVYLTWGKALVEGMRARGIPADYAMVATGCPRYDYCAPAWSGALPRLWEKGKDRSMVLVNSSLSFAYPRYQSVEKEIHEAITVQKLSPEWVHQRVAETRMVGAELRKTLEHLAPRFPDVDFVVRPHPFEDNTLFQDLADRFPNVAIRQKGTVFPWIKDAVAMLHHCSTTSVDCVFMGKDPVMLDWVKAPTIHVQIAQDVSLLPQGLEETESLLRRLLAGEAVEVPEETRRRREALVRDWFHANDGGSSARVADGIRRVLAGRPGPRGLFFYLGRLVSQALRAGDPAGAAKRGLGLLLGARRLGKLKSLRKPDTKKSGKEFSTGEVEAICERLAKVDRGRSPARVAWAREPFRHPTPGAHFTIRISR